MIIHLRTAILVLFVSVAVSSKKKDDSSEEKPSEKTLRAETADIDSSEEAVTSHRQFALGCSSIECGDGYHCEMKNLKKTTIPWCIKDKTNKKPARLPSKLRKHKFESEEQLVTEAASGVQLVAGTEASPAETSSTQVTKSHTIAGSLQSEPHPNGASGVTRVPGVTGLYRRTHSSKATKDFIRTATSKTFGNPGSYVTHPTKISVGTTTHAVSETSKVVITEEPRLPRVTESSQTKSYPSTKVFQDNGVFPLTGVPGVTDVPPTSHAPGVTVAFGKIETTTGTHQETKSVPVTEVQPVTETGLSWHSALTEVPVVTATAGNESEAFLETGVPKVTPPSSASERPRATTHFPQTGAPMVTGAHNVSGALQVTKQFVGTSVGAPEAQTTPSPFSGAPRIHPAALRISHTNVTTAYPKTTSSKAKHPAYVTRAGAGDYYGSNASKTSRVRATTTTTPKVTKTRVPKSTVVHVFGTPKATVIHTGREASGVTKAKSGTTRPSVTSAKTGTFATEVTGPPKIHLTMEASTGAETHPTSQAPIVSENGVSEVTRTNTVPGVTGVFPDITVLGITIIPQSTGTGELFIS